MPPSEQSQRLERLAWRSIDQFCMDNPKPRMSVREKHRAKLWFRERINSRIALSEVDMETFYYPLGGMEMVEMRRYVERTIDD